MDNSVEFLSTVEIFSLLKPEEIGRISGLFRTREIDDGEILFREGDEGNELFIVRSGVVASTIALPGGGRREVASFSAGNFFGEMSIFEKAPRSATCHSKERSVVMSLHEGEFYQLIEKYPDIATKIMYRMLNITTQRLRDTGEFLSDMVQWGEAARKRAITDELTGAYNRRFMDDALESQFEIARSGSRSLSLLMVDLDFFRDINNNYGHEAGDRCIIEVVHTFNRNLRETDMLSRFGGDEFVVLMPDTDGAVAAGIAEKSRLEVESLDILKAHNSPVKKLTLSIGIASFPGHAADLKSLKAMADQALYRAKEGGRNRCVSAG